MADTMVESGPVADAPRRRRVGRRAVVAILVALVLIAGGITGTAVSLHYAHAPALECACGFAWLSEADAAIQVNTEADGHTQTTVPVRLGEQQGFLIWIVNRSDVTQTILGPQAGFFFGFGQSQTQLLVATSDANTVDPRHATYASRATLAPGHARWMKIAWTNAATCPDEPGQIGSGLSLDSVPVRVRVGAFTRTEHIDLATAVGIVVKHC